MIPGKGYKISGKIDWVTPHEIYGKPTAIAGIYLGSLSGTRTWHLFEIRLNGEDKGCIMMPEKDLNLLTVEEIV